VAGGWRFVPVRGRYRHRRRSRRDGGHAYHFRFRPDISISANSQWAPDIAWSGSEYFVIWLDLYDLKTEGASLWGSRVSGTGEYLDGPGILIAHSTWSQIPARVAWTGENFLVVWDEDYGGDLVGARIAADGTLLDPDPFLISEAGIISWFGLASNGSTTLVVWERQQSHTHSVVGTRVTADGEVLDGEGFLVGAHTWVDVFPGAGWDGTNWLVTWSHRLDDVDDIYGARVTPGGEVLDHDPIRISTAPEGQYYPVVASSRDGSGTLVAWRDFRAAGELSDVYAARVTVDGQVLDPDGILLGHGAPVGSSPRVAWDGAAYLVTWEQQVEPYTSDVLGVRVNRDGVVLDRSPLAIATSEIDEFDPAVTAGPSGRSAVVHVRFRLPEYAAWRVFLRFVDEPRPLESRPSSPPH
jgi:hypothetical protein